MSAFPMVVFCLVTFSALSRVRREKPADKGVRSWGMAFTTDRRTQVAFIAIADERITFKLSVSHVAKGTGYECSNRKYSFTLAPSIFSFRFVAARLPNAHPTQPSQSRKLKNTPI